MNILIISNDLVYTAQLQVLLSSLSKNIMFASCHRGSFSFIQPPMGHHRGYDLIFIELDLFEQGRVSLEDITRINNQKGLLVFMGERLLDRSKLEIIPRDSSFLEKPVNFQKLQQALAEIGIVLEKLNCWQYKRCGRGPGDSNSQGLGVCPAASEPQNNDIHQGLNAGRSCWVVSGTLCDDDVQGSFASKVKSCMDCDFYRLVASEEGDSFESIHEALQIRQHDLTGTSVSEGTFGVDNSGAIISFNMAVEKITGYSSQELQGQPHQIFFSQAPVVAAPGENRIPPSPILAALKSGQVYRSRNEVFLRRDGSSFPVDLTCAPIVEEDVVLGAMVLFKDITDELCIQRKKERVEQELRDLTETLEERVMKRTAKLNTANQDLTETLDRLQQTQAQLVESEKMASLGGLVAGVAHEINTPVGIAYTASTHLEKETARVVAIYQDGKMKRRDFEEYLSTCQEATRLLNSNLNRAAELIRSFKQVAIDQSVEGKRTFKLREYLDEILLSLRPVLKKAGHIVKIDCDDEIILHSYAGAFSQIVTNLVTNSVTHGFTEIAPGQISMEFSRVDDNWLFSYRDDGRGINAEHLARIFDPFFTTTRAKGGSGLGMHIVYNIITQKLKGTISCQSEPGRGTTFLITIPIQ